MRVDRAVHGVVPITTPQLVFVSIVFMIHLGVLGSVLRMWRVRIRSRSLVLTPMRLGHSSSSVHHTLLPPVHPPVPRPMRAYGHPERRGPSARSVVLSGEDAGAEARGEGGGGDEVGEGGGGGRGAEDVEGDGVLLLCLGCLG